MLALQPLPLPPDALVERARQVLASVGHEPERRWGIPLFFAIALLMTYLGMEEAPLAVRLPLAIAGAAVYSLAFVRFGLVAGFAMVFFLSWRLPFPTTPQTWYFGTAAVLLLAALALPVWGLVRSLGAARGWAAPGT